MSDGGGESGSGEALDRRFHAVRDDLAAQALKGRVAVPAFAPGRRCQVRWGAVAVRREPRPDAAVDTEALYGERAILYDEADGWAWVQLINDHYVGYVPTAALSTEVHAPTHRVAAILAIVYAKASALSQLVRHVPFNAAVSVTGVEGAFAELAGGGFIGREHLVALDETAGDFVATAVRFTGVPYRFGGKSAFGVDCSGLVQNAFNAAGMNLPRDSDVQYRCLSGAQSCRWLGAEVGGLRRGDIAIWSDHIGLLGADGMLVHATATRMAVVSEPFEAVLARTTSQGSQFLGAVRLRERPEGGPAPQFIEPLSLPAGA